MHRERILITVKTYPVPSRTYSELVCTGGIREDGSWVRIYPAPLRFFNDQAKYAKYQWIEIDLQKNPKDHRPESYIPTNMDAIVLGDIVKPQDDWQQRRQLILNQNRIYTNLNEIIKLAHDNKISMAIFKPTKIIDFIAEPAPREWDIDRVTAALAAKAQGSLFDDFDDDLDKLMPKVPYKFRYIFEDNEGKRSSLMIEDWETGQLYWNCLRRAENNEQIAVKKVREKYFDEFLKKKDLYFFLGTTFQFHQMKSRNPYVIIGTFHPPRQVQLDLFAR